MTVASFQVLAQAMTVASFQVLAHRPSSVKVDLHPEGTEHAPEPYAVLRLYFEGGPEVTCFVHDPEFLLALDDAVFTAGRMFGEEAVKRLEASRGTS